jgi:hypothetical protein
MENSKLVILLKSFDSSELRAFQDFLASPYFNKKEINLRLFRLLKNLAKEGFPNHKLKRSLIYKKLYPSQPYDELKLNHVISEVFRLAEQFLSIQHFQQKRALPSIMIAEAHYQRKQDKAFVHQVRKIRKTLDSSSKKDSIYFHQKSIMLMQEERFFPSRSTDEEDNLQKAAYHFDGFYLLQKLKYLCLMLDRQKFMVLKYDLSTIPLTLELLEKAPDPIKNSPSITTYIALLNALLERDSRPHFLTFKQLLKQNNTVFTIQEAKELYLLAINFCIHHIRIGQREYAEDLFHLYTEGIEQSILFNDGVLSTQTYKNIIKLGLGLLQLEWVEQFIKKYSQYLYYPLREDAYHFNLADLYFHKKEYHKAMMELNQVEFSNINYNLDSKVMLLKIYFEQDEIEPMLSLIATFKIFLRRQKGLSKNVKDSYLNFAKLLQKVYRHHRTSSDHLVEEIKSTTALSDRTWLLKQLQH